MGPQVIVELNSMQMSELASVLGQAQGALIALSIGHATIFQRNHLADLSGKIDNVMEMLQEAIMDYQPRTETS